jgi:hypothetical protein
MMIPIIHVRIRFLLDDEQYDLETHFADVMRAAFPTGDSLRPRYLIPEN